ncbi:hypothetical protein L4C34_19405 [Vibrio profundum]
MATVVDKNQLKKHLVNEAVESDIPTRMFSDPKEAIDWCQTTLQLDHE